MKIKVKVKVKVKLNVVLECYSINPILDRKDKFIWLGQQKPPIIEIGNAIEFIMINIKKIKLSLDNNILRPLELQFPFTYNDFITFASKLASNLTKISTWLNKLQYMKDYIIAPLMISSKEVLIGIIILDELILKPVLKPSDILESNNYLSQIKSKKKHIITNTNNGVEWKCDMLSGILEMNWNKLSAQMKLYIMNCRSYIPPVLIHRMSKTSTALQFVSKTTSKAKVV